MDVKEKALLAHEQWKGKLDIRTKCPITNAEELSIAYTPGVAEPCLKIRDDVELSYTYTGRGNLVAVVTDGTAVLGLGDIGPEAGMPVMEGKCALFKAFGGVDAVPLCIRSKDVDDIVNTVALLAGSFGGINLEDISAPRCFEIERKLKQRCDIPIFHDDQHGTAVITLAGLLNALKVVNKDIATVRVVINGAGSAGIAIAQHLLRLGVTDLTLCDTCGILTRTENYDNPAHNAIAAVTNPACRTGTLADAMAGADVFIGVSAPNVVTPAMVASMADSPIVFPMANPVPEITPEAAREGGAAVVGTGRSDYPNQINNVLAFPGIFRGALDVRASDINEAMKLAASYAIADLVSAQELSADYILPRAFDPRVGPAVAAAVAQAARASGVARK